MEHDENTMELNQNSTKIQWNTMKTRWNTTNTHEKTQFTNVTLLGLWCLREPMFAGTPPGRLGVFRLRRPREQILQFGRPSEINKNR